MANKRGTTNDILVKVDQNNLMYIDPNSVIDKDGQVLPREVQPENLVTYVNLEADLIPRTTLISGNDTNTLTSIAKGTFNLMRNAEGRDFDSKWTESYTEYDQKFVKDKEGNKVPIDEFYQHDSTAQSFGIDSISIRIEGMNLVPQVNIKFIDVRGKTLFESPENSPYKAFFHLPWPIFYLTVKGFYGKAIRYRLHLVKFNTRFNSSNGNFEIETTFVGSTYAYLNDIPLDGIMEAAYMYPIEVVKDTKFNEKTKTYDKTIKKTSRGYSVLKSVYSEYRQKGLLPKTFPDRTLREVISIARRLESILEEEIFSKTVDPRILNDVAQFDRTMQEFEKSIKNWKTKFLSAEFFTDKPDETIEYNVHLDKTGKPATTFEQLTGETAGSLFLIIKNYTNAIDSNQAFGKSRDNKLLKDKTIKIRTISASALLNVKSYCKSGAKIGVNINGILNTLYTIQKEYVEERAKLERVIEERMNNIIKRKDIGIGFEPTIRNVIGLILANADTYIRLLKDVHYRAFQVAEERKNILNAVSTDSIGESIYPWPEVKKPATGKKQNVLVYPGAYEMSRTLQSYDTRLWPEVDFVENYNAVATKKTEPADEKETGPELINFLSDNDSDKNKRNEISLLTTFIDVTPYGDKSISSILYEIYERAKYFTSVDSFKNETIRELALLEFDNIKNQIAEDFDIIEILKSEVKNVSALKKYMLGFSAYERYPYYEDQQPTIPYIKESLDNGFKIEQYKPKNNVVDNKALYPNLSKNLLEYVGEEYRTKMYPFNSNEYISYLKMYGYSGYTANQIHLKGMVRLDTVESLASSSIEPNMWHYAEDNQYVQNTGSTVQWKTGKNLFDNSIPFDTLNYTGGTYNGKEHRFILNTPYFHKQLYKDFRNPKSKGRYAGSAYLLLSQMNFKALSHQVADTLNIIVNAISHMPQSGVLMSTLFKELAATHYIPYHLVLQWGAVYHRYKKYLTEGEDILSGMTQPIDMNLFFDNNQNLTYNFTLTGGTNTSYSLTRNNEKSYGFTPFYHSIYHQVVNDYTFYDPLSATPNTSYVNAINQGVIKLFPTRGEGSLSWNVLIDNSKFDNTKKTLTILPSGGLRDSNYSGYTRQQQDNFKTLWGDPLQFLNLLIGSPQNLNPKNYAPLYSGLTLPTYKQYFTDKDGAPSISSSNKKIIDLIGTFSPELLDTFEEMFLDFSSDTINDEVNQNKFNFKYNSFKSILKELSTIEFSSEDKFSKTEELSNFSLNVYWRQREKMFKITESILSNDNLVKLTITNPKGIDAHVLGGFAQVNVERFSTGIDFDTGQIDQDTQNAIELYVGEDISGYYVDFFRYNNIELNEENVKRFRFLIYVYAGYVKSGGTNTKQAFINYLRNNIILKDSDPISKVSGQENRLVLFLDTLIGRFSTLKAVAGVQRLKIDRGYNDDLIKLELYNYFKSFNDKWIAGNSIGQRGLLEEFLFLNKANVDIGDDVYIDIKKLIEIGDQRNSKKQNLYGTISNLIVRTGFDLRPLPAYVNFYGTNFNNKVKTTPSKSVASNIFGSFLEVDYQESSPKIILQYTGPTSKYLELNEINKKFLYKDDSFNISQTNNNPILVANDAFTRVDFYKSNKAVAFEVSFGDQNQGIFKGIELDQSSVRNTSESFQVLENLGANETGSSTAQVDVGLFDIYRSQSYTCNVTMMGDVMIQPTMYFYLKNIPLFKGTYLIQEVNHSIRNNVIETSFKGTRIPITSLPDPKDSFMASYRALFDKMVAKATAKTKEADRVLKNVKNGDKVFTDTKGNTYSYNTGGKEISGEKIIERASITSYGVPYNGYEGQKDIQLAQYEEGEWLRAIVTPMGGSKYAPADDVDLGIVSRYEHLSGSTIINEKVKWLDVKNTGDKQQFYSTQINLGGSLSANDLISKYGNTEFYNPKPNVKKKVTIKTSFDYTNKKFNGPIHYGLSPDYGISMSKSLMTQLDLYEGDVVYFRLTT